MGPDVETLLPTQNQQGEDDIALRFNDEKPRLSLLLEADAALVGATRIMEFGATKYSRSNWKKGLKYTEVIDSMMRHLLNIMAGEDVDKESNLPNADHLLVNALFLAQMMATRPDMDDRSKA